jgi:hypothetical protein
MAALRKCSSEYPTEADACRQYVKLQAAEWDSNSAILSHERGFVYAPTELLEERQGRRSENDHRTDSLERVRSFSKFVLYVAKSGGPFTPYSLGGPASFSYKRN